MDIFGGEKSCFTRSWGKYINDPLTTAVNESQIDALTETVDVLSDYSAMEAIHFAQTGKTKYRLLNLYDQNFGL